ncbi:MAG: TetR family transcriptional regulator [Clostridia bacterium]|nr:TetR family transcriptional regulator [Clostridia bacterium]
MPKAMKYSKEEVVQVAYEIVKEEGIEGINARKIAKKLNASVHPIFNHFENIEELKKAVVEKIVETYHSYMISGKGKEKYYKETGLSYIRFAKDFPQFFKIMFMNPTKLDAKNFIMADSAGDEIIKAGQILTGLSYEEQKTFHVEVWMLTHGIACLVATKTVELSDEEIGELLENTVRQMIIGYKFEKENKKK